MQRDRVLQLPPDRPFKEFSVVPNNVDEERPAGAETSDDSVDMGEFDHWTDANRVEDDYKKLMKLLSDWQVEGDMNKRLMLGTVANRVDRMYHASAERAKRLNLYADQTGLKNLTPISFVQMDQHNEKINETENHLLKQ